MEIKRVKTNFEDHRGKIIDIIANEPVEYATLITSAKGAVRANHFHKDTFQYLYVLSGKLRVVVQMPGMPAEEGVMSEGDLIETVPDERHAFEALEDSAFLVLTRGPRGGEDYEKDTYRLEEPLIAHNR
jgi:quercetin dioxygenase-like cupin family protein